MNNFLIVLYKERSLAPLMVLGAVLGMVQGMLVLGWQYINASANDYVVLSHDRTSYQMGINYYVQGDWEWPVHHVDNLQFPSGTNIIFTDSLPLLAPFAKIYYQVTGKIPDYFGDWLLVCYILQGSIFVWLLYLVGVKSLWMTATGALLAIAVPAFLFRWGHVSLCSHFLILLAIGFYLKSRRDWKSVAAAVAFTALICVSILIHAYLAAFVIGFCVLSLLQITLDGRDPWWRALLCLASSLIFVFLFMLLLGMIGGSVQSVGFGSFNMNAIAPFLPNMSGLVPGAEELFNPPGTGQYEGYNYLGLGVIFLLFAAAMSAPISYWRSVIKRNVILAIYLILLYLYSLSNNIYVWEFKVISLPVPQFFESLVNTFRGSGRFFWPITYVLLLLSLLTLNRYKQKSVSLVTILALVVVIQYLDIRPHYRVQEIRAMNPREVSDVMAWEELMSKSTILDMVPRTTSAPHDLKKYSLDLTLIASRLNIPVTTAYVSRGESAREVGEQRSDLVDRLPLEQGRLLVLLKPPFTASDLMDLMPAEDVAEGENVFVAGKDIWNENEETLRSLGFSGLGAPSYPLGIQIKVSPDDRRWLNHTTGLEHHGGIYEGRWITGSKAAFFFPLNHIPTSNLLFEVTGLPQVGEANPSMTIDVIAEGVMVDAWDAGADGRKTDTFQAVIPQELLTDSIVSIELNIQDPVSHKDLGIGNDRTPLGLWVQSFVLHGNGPETVSSGNGFYRFGDVIRFSRDDPVVGQWDGVSGREDRGQWTEGSTTIVKFPVQRSAGGDLLLEVSGHAFLTSEHTFQSINVIVEGVKVASWDIVFHEHVGRWSARIPDELVIGKPRLEIRLEIERPRSPKELGVNDDGRKLGIYLENMILSEIVGQRYNR